jgi:hypothetical protein
VSEVVAFGLCAVAADEPTCALVSKRCTNVPNDPSDPIPDGESPETAADADDAVAGALDAARRAWDLEHDGRALRCALLDLLRRLDAAA